MSRQHGAGGDTGVPSLALGTCCLKPGMPVTCPRSRADSGDQLKVEDSRGLQDSGLQRTGGCGQGAPGVNGVLLPKGEGGPLETEAWQRGRELAQLALVRTAL